jgi:hypothetical protein
VSVRQLAALARRHLIAVSLILLVTAGIAIGFRYTGPGYEETTVVAVEPEIFRTVPAISDADSFLENASLITTCQLLVTRLSGPQGEAQLRQAGVTGSFAVSVVNSSNSDTPDYTYPYLSVSVTGRDPDATHDQWTGAMQVISTDIADLPGNQHLAQHRIVTYVLSDSGPISQRGSLVRTYAALMFLALVAMYLICRFLDRRSRAAVGPIRKQASMLRAPRGMRP